MAANRIVFVAFAIEDERQRDFLKGQSLHPRAPYEFTDMSVKEAYDSGWKEKVRTRIRRSDGVIVLVSKNSLTSSGQKWEIECAKEEGKKIRGIWAYSNDRTSLAGISTVAWSDTNISNFIDSL
ncbi:TIR domain-containing protein [Afipia birgiae]|uniref:TIR domain-containing protein n=1 Tax=Afipia birgiae TaxID=151414 RepID=UPI0002DD593C|nr:TIR domain-containing protein [Afipia birgiae]MBX9822476.1 TIR domain-containing protein [Afipia birgiae]